MLGAYVAKPWPVADNQVYDFPNFLGFVSKVYPSPLRLHLAMYRLYPLTTQFQSTAYSQPRSMQRGIIREEGLVWMGTSVFHRSSTFSPTVINSQRTPPAGRTTTAHAWVDCSQAKNNADFNYSLLYGCYVALRQTQLPNYRELNHNYCIMF